MIIEAELECLLQVLQSIVYVISDKARPGVGEGWHQDGRGQEVHNSHS